MLLCMSMGFDGAVIDWALSWVQGACLVAPDSGDSGSLVGDGLMQHCNKHAITHMTVTPSLLATAVVQKCSTLLMLGIAGEAAPPQLVARWREQVPIFLNCFGPSECTIATNVFDFNADSTLHLHNCNGSPIGRPTRRHCCYIADADGLLLPPGYLGNLFIAGDGVAEGYLNLPQLTADKFAPDCYATLLAAEQLPRRMYNTGDLVAWSESDEGVLMYHGRKDEQVKINGVRIELGEVQQVCAVFDGVEQVEVLLCSGASGSSPVLVAFYTLPASAVSPFS